VRRYCLVVSALAIIVMTALAGCQPHQLSSQDGHKLLQQIWQAKHNVSLRGTLTTTTTLGDRTLTAQARLHRGAGRLQMVFTSGKGRGMRIIGQEGMVWQIAPDGKAVRRLPRSPISQMPPLGKNMIVELSKGKQITGRATDKIVIRPHPHAHARLEIWADKENRFPLQSDRYNSEGDLVSSTKYTLIDFSVTPPPLAKVPATKDKPGQIYQQEKIDEHKAKQLLGTAPVEASYLPKGFAFRGYYAHKARHGNAVELRYSDGMRVVSLLESRLGQVSQREAKEGELATRREALRQEVRDRRNGSQRAARTRGLGRRLAGFGSPERHGDSRGFGQVMRSRLRGKMVRIEVGDLIVVITGEIPLHELRKVADSLRESSLEF